MGRGLVAGWLNDVAMSVGPYHRKKVRELRQKTDVLLRGAGKVDSEAAGCWTPSKQSRLGMKQTPVNGT